MNTLKQLLQLENELIFNSFDSDDALKLGLIFVEIAKKLNKGSIGIKIEKNNHTLFSHLMNGTSPENRHWYNRKKNFVDRYFHSSKYVEEMFKNNGTTFEKSGLLNPEFFQAVGGSFPLIIKMLVLLDL